MFLALAHIFSAGFETGDLSEWSAVVGAGERPVVEIMAPVDGAVIELEVEFAAPEVN